MSLFQMFEPGIVRDSAIGFKFVLIFLCGMFTVLFGLDTWDAHRQKVAVQLEPAWMVFFGAFMVTELFYLLGDIYGFERELLLDGSYTLMMVASTGLVYGIETNSRYKTHGLFWKFCLVIAIATALLPREPSRFLLFWVVAPVLFVFILMFLVTMRHRLKGGATYAITGFFSGLLMTLAGVFLSADYFIAIGGDGLYIGGQAVSAAGFTLMGFSALHLRSLKELEWFTAVQRLIFASKAGEVVYTLNFSPGVPSITQDILSAGGLSGVNSILKEISRTSSNVRYIDQQDSALLFYHGQWIVGILFSKFYLDALYIKLHRVVNLLESAYGDHLTHQLEVPALQRGIGALAAGEFAEAMKPV